MHQGNKEVKPKGIQELKTGNEQNRAEGLLILGIFKRVGEDLVPVLDSVAFPWLKSSLKNQQCAGWILS